MRPNSMNPWRRRSGIRLLIETEAGATVRAQPELLAQAITNLIDNAVKHTAAGGRISVAVKLLQGTPRLDVADTGPGIPAADRERVLDRFVRLEESRSTPGAGLGLSLVAAVARMHGADLTLGDGRPGLVVSLTFPRLMAARDSAQHRTGTEGRVVTEA